MWTRRGRKFGFLLAWLSIVVLLPELGFGQKLKLGEPAPNFSVALLDGRRAVRLSDFRGRRVLVFTWASW